jgi:hypothetical protein
LARQRRREVGGEVVDSLLLYQWRWRRLATAAQRCAAAEEQRARRGAQRGEKLVLRVDWALEEDKGGSIAAHVGAGPSLGAGGTGGGGVALSLRPARER